MCETSSIGRPKRSLVIGINDYQARNRLQNPENDARDMASALREIKFEVKECLNGTYREMESSLKSFIGDIQENDMVLFYFAGHGQQWEDQNYLIPSDDDAIEGETMKDEAFNVQEILNQIGEKRPFVIIVLLDCCREYHLRHRELPNACRGHTDVDAQAARGLKKIYASAPTNCLIAFACAPGHIASDFSSNGRNGLFTWHLLQHIKKPNKDIRMVLTDVASGVYNETQPDGLPQVPWLNCHLKVHDIFLHAAPSSELSAVQSPDSGIDMKSNSELEEAASKRFDFTGPDAPATFATAKKEDTFSSPYANDYLTIKALGKGSFGCVFEVVHKLPNQRLAVKRIAFKTDRQLKAAVKETQALAQLHHPHIIRYFHTWIETPPPGWQKEQDETYDWRDVSRNERIKTMTSEASSTYAGTTADDGDASFYDITHFLKISPSAQADASQVGDAAEDLPADAAIQTPVVEDLANVLLVTSIQNEGGQALPVEQKQEISYLYYSMELCSEDTLAGRLSPSTLTKEETCHILRQLIETIAHIHQAKMIHGDIKPTNIFFSSANNSLKIGDFGLAIELLDSDQAVIEGRKAPGTRWYMAPELRVKQGTIEYDEKVDIYAMGIVFLELLAPFKSGADRSRVLEEIRKYTKKSKDILPLLRSYEKAQNYHLMYEPIIVQLLSPSPSARPSAKELLANKSFLRLIQGVHIEQLAPSARWIQDIPLRSTDIAYGDLACSEHQILLYEKRTFTVFNTAGQRLAELDWSKHDYEQSGFVSCIIWSVYLRAFLVLSHRALFQLTYADFRIRTRRIGAVYAADKERESRMRFITCDSRADYLFLNRGYQTIQQYKMSVWAKRREWSKSALNYADTDEIRGLRADRDGRYLLLNIRQNGTLSVVDVRAVDEPMTLTNRIERVQHKLQLLSPPNFWLFVREDSNRLCLYDIEGGREEKPKEVSFGKNENDPQFSFSRTAPVHFRWLGSTHLVLGTTVDGSDTGVLKIYRI